MADDDPRIDLIREVERRHMFAVAGIATGSQQEHWRCFCGSSYRGKGAIELGHRHQAAEVLAALDATAVPS